ncbi:hypothetical protein [Streptomyces mirabilis]|uniref:hypothetical protein n=1 Tax=Streptomyces mirabilis TaxID=68239 RepID=UPI00225369B4|nr:hypothetical protein [Streptomyces mirabilis]MCX4425980.1 hypothetical protein [Streptomyces mirabilis]
MAELPATADADRATAHRYFDDFVLRRLPAALATARQDTVTAAMALLAEMFLDAGGMVRLSREQARCRAGDFEIIEYILRGQPGGVPGTWGHHFDDCLLHAPITDQHRNKIAHQAALIESALGSDPADVPSTAPSPDPHHPVPPVPPRRHVLLLQHRDPEPVRRPDDPHRPLEPRRTHPRRHRGRRPSRRAAGKEPSPGRTSPPMPPA